VAFLSILLLEVSFNLTSSPYFNVFSLEMQWFLYCHFEDKLAIMKITIGIASTTHLDRHNERMAKSALEDMARQIKEKYKPQLVEHDWNKHVGVILYGEVFQLEDGEYALGIVSSLFENENERQSFKTGQANKVWQDYKKYLKTDELTLLANEKSLESKVVVNTRDKNIAELLETHLDSTKFMPNGIVYKIKRYIAATGDLRIEIYPKDHYPPHFHIISKQRGINARFSIETLDLISTKEGKIKESDVRKIKNFLLMSPDVLDKLRSEYRRLQ
jgi:hypothetical protein